MSYKPKHCCQCGEKIDRIDWKPWTSRRFCELCETEFGIYEWLSRGFVAAAVLLGLFGIGSYLRSDDKPLNIAQKQIASVAPKVENVRSGQTNTLQVSTNFAVQNSAQTSNSAAALKPQIDKKAANLKTKQVESSANESPEETYFCGAETKKGTMCSHRVKGGGRCWQHAGQTAMLPPQKLKL